MDAALKDRAMGAIMGAFIGDALALGPHWYYNLEEMRKEYGEWITTYTDPKPGRYHENQKAGDLSQAGIILKLTIQSIVRSGGYSEKDFCETLDKELLSKLDGVPMHGPGGYTSQSIREVWRRRVEQKREWDDVGSRADTTEAMERTLALEVLYARDLRKLAHSVASNTRLTQVDDIIGSMAVAFAAVLSTLVKGEKLDSKIGMRLMALSKTGELPFHVVTTGEGQPPGRDAPDPSNVGKFASPDALLTAAFMAQTANDPDIRIEPAWKVSLVYGMPCAAYHILPSAYYLAAHYSDDFESAVLHAVNGGGQNLARAILTGCLVGAQVGFSKIPQRFIDGLNDKAELLELADKLASLV